MKPAPFDYVRPDSIEAAIGHLADAGGDASLLAGGQTLVPLLALRMATPSLIVDINRIGDLAGVSQIAGGTRIGATTRQAEILADPIVARQVPALRLATAFVGHHQTRNRGTIGGSIALGEPAAEYPATAMALGAVIEARSLDGVRRIEADDFFLGPYATALQPDELLVAIEFPDWPADSLIIVHEVARRPGDFALVGLVAMIALAEGKVARAGIAWFGMGPTPLRSRLAEQAMVGAAPADLDLRAIAELAVGETDPFDEEHATAGYRRTVARRIFTRLVGERLAMRRAA